MIKISPKSFLRNQIFETNIPKPHKRRKVSVEEFNIPGYNEWELLLQKNYNVSQLKQMARYYKLKISGNKTELVTRVYNNLKYSNYAITIQKQWRGALRRKYNQLQGRASINRECVNTTDFLSLGDIKKIPYSQFFSFQDNGQIFGFSAKSLHNLILKNNKPTNPYTRETIPKATIEKFNKFLKYGKILHETANVVISDDAEYMSMEKRINLKAQTIFYKIDTFGHITDAKWFLTLNKPMLIKLIRELIDIWEYRAQLSQTIKRSICPPHGTPFAGLNINHLITQNITVLKTNILNIFENLVSKSQNRENQSLGAYYILCAITLVSQPAAVAYPWLYESVVYN
jgi:hypothetical protein